jgi:hypothetical protein
MQNHRTLDYNEANRMRTSFVRKFAYDLTVQWNVFDDRTNSRVGFGPWTVVPPSDEPESKMDCRATVTDGDLGRFLISISHPYTKLDISYIPPLKPTLSGHGAYHPLRDFLSYEYRAANGAPDLKASVTLERAEKDSAKIATEFWKRVAVPTQEILPLVRAKLDETHAGIEKQKATAIELLRRHPGMKRYDNRGDSIVLGMGQDVNLPGFIVDYNGIINIPRTFTMSLETASTLYAAVLKESVLDRATERAVKARTASAD